MKLLDVIAEAKRKKDMGLFVDAIPYAKFLGISVAEEQDGLISTLRYRDRNIGNPALPAIHGGVVGAFLETTAILQLLWQQESIRVPKIITITIDYLRSAGPADTYGRADVTKLGARVANVRVWAWQDSPDRAVASANANFLVTPADDEAAG